VAERGRLLSHEPEALALRMAKHFGHKVPVEQDGDRTVVMIPAGRFALEPAGDELLIELEPESEETLPRLREVVVTHLERFARGAPVDVSWCRQTHPHAVNLSLAMGGRVVWFPTIASPKHIEHHREHPQLKFPSLAVDLIPEEAIDVFANGGGQLKPEVHEAAKGHGVRRMIVNHPNFVIEATKDEVKQLAELGALIEHSLCMYDEESSFHNWRIDTLVDWIRWVGPERSSLGSDLGQAGNPFPADSFRKICSRLLEAGMTEREVRMLVADNPARLLGVG
jgi:hypothetical protein